MSCQCVNGQVPNAGCTPLPLPEQIRDIPFCKTVTTSGAQLSTISNHNTLIADQFNNRVIEVDPKGKIVWHFGLGPADFSPQSIIRTNDAERVGRFTLMAGTGTPGGQPEAPNCTNPNGCPDNRVLLVDRDGNIVWQYGQFGVAGSGPDQLNRSGPEYLAFQWPHTHYRPGE